MASTDSGGASTSPPVIEFFYDFVCPYAYLAWTQIDELARAAGTRVELKPMLLGGLFRAIGAPDSPTMSPPRARLNALDLERWSKRLGVPLNPPPAHPRRTVLALRAAIASGDVKRATAALFAAYWRDGLDLSDPGVVRSALDGAGLDGAASVNAAEKPEVKAELKERTAEAVSLGIFGAPTCVVKTDRGREIFWGQDRLDFVARAVTGAKPAPPETTARDQDAPATELQFYFDFSSPFAYLASTQVRALVARTGADLVLKPVLLGALFKAIGTANVPLFDMPEPKRIYSGVELDRWAKHWDVPFVFSTVFPMNTVKALRLVLMAPREQRHDLVDALFRGAWVEGRDLNREDTLATILREAGCSPELLAEITSPAAKDALREATAEAEARGLCGVPSFVVKHAASDPGELYWGQDRLVLVEADLTRHRSVK